MGHILKLQTGDKRSPTRTLLLSDGTSDGNIYIHTGGFSPGPGAINMQMSGRTIRADGQDRVASSRDNIAMSVIYDLRGDTYAELQYVQGQIQQFLEEARLYHEHDLGEKVYLYYRWSTPAMDDIGIPEWGQFGYFFEVISGEATWPDNLHTGQLVSGNIESVTLDLVCKPFPEGLDQWAFNADGIPDVDADVELTYDLSSNEFDGDFTLCGWIEHRESDYYAFEAYQDAADWINIFWDESDSRYELNSRVSSSTTTTNGSSQSLSAGDLVHICIVGNDGGNDAWYINGTAQTAGSSSQDWGSVEFTLASATSAGGVTGNTNELDGWKLFDDALTADEVSGIYNQELPIKSQTRGNKLIAPPVWLKTRSGDGVFENVDGVISASAQDNWGIVGGVPGDVEAKVKWEIDPGSTTPERVFWLGRQAVQSTFTPDGTTWFDYSGTADSGNSSGDAYESTTAVGEADFDYTISGTPITNQFQVLGRFSATSGAIMQPYYQLGTAAGNTKIKGDKVTVGSSSANLLANFGRVYFDWRNLKGSDAMAGIIGQVDSKYPYNGLVAHYTLDEASGTRVDNINGYDLSAVNNPLNNTGKLSSAVELNGSTQYLSNSTDDELWIEGSFTITGWVWMDTVASTADVLSKWKASTNKLSWIILFNSGTSRFEFRLSSDGTNQTTISADNAGAPSANTWYFFAVVYNAKTDTAKIKINDNDFDSDTHLDGVFEVTAAEANFRLGTDSDGLNLLDGRVDDVSMWSRVLTNDEISNVYNGGTGLSTPATGTITLDFLQLLPKPSCRVEINQFDVTIAATDYIVIDDRQAYILESDLDHKYTLEFEGDDVAVIPEYYNYIFLLNAQEGRTYQIDDTNTVSAYVTPRWLLVGG